MRALSIILSAYIKICSFMWARWRLVPPPTSIALLLLLPLLLFYHQPCAFTFTIALQVLFIFCMRRYLSFLFRPHRNLSLAAVTPSRPPHTAMDAKHAERLPAACHRPWGRRQSQA